MRKDPTFADFKQALFNGLQPICEAGLNSQSPNLTELNMK